MAANSLVPNEGEVQLATDLLGGGTLEDWLLCLITSSVTPSETDTAATWTAAEASFTGYSRKTLTRAVGAGNWSTPTSGAPTDSWSSESAVAQSLYNSGAPQSWTAGSGVSETVYGFFYVGATSNKLIFCQLFDTPQPIVAGNIITITPPFGAA